MDQLSHPYMTTEKQTLQIFVDKVMSPSFNILFMFVIAFNEQVSFNFMAAPVTVCSDFGAQEKKIRHCFHFYPLYLPWRDGIRYRDLSFLNVELQASFFTLLFHPHQEIFSSSSFSAIRVVSSAYLRLLLFLLEILIPAMWFIQPSILHDVLCI